MHDVRTPEDLTKMTCTYGVDKIVLYERYIQNKRDQNDIAVVHLDRTIQFRSDVKPICLPEMYF